VKKVIRISDYVDANRVELLAQAEKSELGHTLMEACRRRSARVVSELRKTPKINPEKIEDDIRYKFGQADEVEFILDLMTECQRQLT